MVIANCLLLLTHGEVAAGELTVKEGYCLLSDLIKYQNIWKEVFGGN